VGTTGYGYDDFGRDNLERVYADVFHTEAALVRPQITCGTHALTIALSANLLPGDELLSPVGLPYDTLQEVIGIRPSPCSLAEYGVSYRQAELKEDGSFDYDKISATLTSADGKVLVGHKPYVRGNKKPIAPRKPATPPAEIETIEELVLNGKHLVQYRHFAYEPTDYFKEALRRDPGDSRSNTEMGNYYLARGEFETAIEYYDRAIARLTIRNDNPADTEALYHKGLALRYLGRLDEAYDALYRSAWQYNYMSGAYYALACIDCKRGDSSDSCKIQFTWSI
jgi:tetratricopeptide (TPR) repeat protein